MMQANATAFRSINIAPVQYLSFTCPDLWEKGKPLELGRGQKAAEVKNFCRQAVGIENLAFYIDQKGTLHERTSRLTG